MSTFDDADDWDAVLAGDGEAFGRVFDRHRDAVRRSVRRLVAQEADAEDVLAVVFLEAWRRRAAVRLVDDSVRPWLLVTALHAAQNVRRSARRYRALLDRLPPVEDAPDHADLIDDGRVSGAFRRLSPADQRILTLCVLEDLSERQASEALDVPVGTVKSRLSRAKARLARALPGDLSYSPAEEASHGL